TREDRPRETVRQALDGELRPHNRVSPGLLKDLDCALEVDVRSAPGQDILDVGLVEGRSPRSAPPCRLAHCRSFMLGQLVLDVSVSGRPALDARRAAPVECTYIYGVG